MAGKEVVAAESAKSSASINANRLYKKTRRELQTSASRFRLLQTTRTNLHLT